MKEVPRCLPALAIGVALITGCAGLGGPTQPDPTAVTAAKDVVPDKPRGKVAGSPGGPSPSTPPAPEGGTSASTPKTRSAEPARPGSTVRALPKPTPPTQQSKPRESAPLAPPKLALPAEKTPQPAPAVAASALLPALDLKSLESRLRETKAINVFTKLTLKNQIEDLLERLRAYYRGRVEPSLAELRRSFDLLVMKTLALLQDTDPPLAVAIASSRESIWGILSDPAKLETP